MATPAHRRLATEANVASVPAPAGLSAPSPTVPSVLDSQADFQRKLLALPMLDRVAAMTQMLAFQTLVTHEAVQHDFAQLNLDCELIEAAVQTLFAYCAQLAKENVALRVAVNSLLTDENARIAEPTAHTDFSFALPEHAEFKSKHLAQIAQQQQQAQTAAAAAATVVATGKGSGAARRAARRAAGGQVQPAVALSTPAAVSTDDFDGSDDDVTAVAAAPLSRAGEGEGAVTDDAEVAAGV